MTIHISDEVAFAAAKALYATSHAGDIPFEDRSPEYQAVVCDYARATISAALEAWPGVKESPSWDLRTHERRVEIILPIIRTEQKP